MSRRTISANERMPTLPQYQPARTGETAKPRPRWRIFGYLTVFLVISWAGFLLFTSNVTMAAEGEAEPPVKDEYGSNSRPAFSDMIQLMDLPATYLPETGKHRRSGRLIIVGDVHGMKDELVHLLDKVDFNKKHDHLIFAGDMISKGPDSPGVVDLAMKLGATGVRGNHEDRIILAHKDMKSKHLSMDMPDPNEERDKQQDAMEEISYSHGDYKDRALVRALGEKRIKWLEECPVILRVGKLGSMGEVIVVHAGLAPGVKLERQDPVMVMTMRTMTDDGVPSDEREGKVWNKVWNKYQKSLPKDERSTAIYGHDSKRGLQVEKYSMGIDTGCLRGGQLTAVVIEGGHSDHTHKIVHINCKDGRNR